MHYLLSWYVPGMHFFFISLSCDSDPRSYSRHCCPPPPLPPYGTRLLCIEIRVRCLLCAVNHYFIKCFETRTPVEGVLSLVNIPPTTIVSCCTIPSMGLRITWKGVLSHPAAGGRRRSHLLVETFRSS